MNIKVLRQRLADLGREAEGMFTAIAAAGRDFSEDEKKADDRIASEIEATKANIERVERHMDRQRLLSSTADLNAEAADAVLAANAPKPVPKPKFSSLADQLMHVARAATPGAKADERLTWRNISAGPTGANEGVGSEGGFLVEQQFVNDLLRHTYESGELLKRVRKIPIGPNSNGIKMNGVDETSRATGSRWGGIRTYWTAEAGLKLASMPRFRQVEMTLDKVTGLFYATDELLQDSTALEAWIKFAFPEEIQFKVEDAIMNGTGAGMPLGYLNSGATITVSKEAGQAAATIVPQNIVKMVGRLPSRLRKSAVWIINQDIEPALTFMMLLVKNVAGTENVGGLAVPQVSYVPMGTNGSAFATLMGIPVIAVEYASTLGTAGDIQLVDLSQYLVIDKGGVQSDQSIHVRFIYDETTFRFVYRVNGMPIWNTPMTPYKGSVTQSPYVALETRA